MYRSNYFVYSHNIVTGYSLGRKEVFTYIVRSPREGVEVESWRTKNVMCRKQPLILNMTRLLSLTRNKSK